MSDLKARYEPNFANVSAKVLDGEAVLIHVTRGTYHSLEKVGCHVWQLIEKRQAPADIAATIARQYEIDARVAHQDVSKLIDALLKEDLVIEATEPAAPLNIQQTGNRLPYEAPNLSTFHDMGDLLALDPPMPGLQPVAPPSEPEEK